MRILITIGHPGHVHFYKNFVWAAQKSGHEVAILAEKKMSQLLCWRTIISSTGVYLSKNIREKLRFWINLFMSLMHINSRKDSSQT